MRTGRRGGREHNKSCATHWQRACKLILAKEDVLTVSRALELALLMDAKLELSRVSTEQRQGPWRKITASKAGGAGRPARSSPRRTSERLTAAHFWSRRLDAADKSSSASRA